MSTDAIGYDLEGKVAVVTGATRGLGRAVSERLAEAGARVAIVGRSTRSDPHHHLPGTLDEVAESLAARAVDVLPIVADLSRPDDVSRIAAEVLEWAGRCDVLVSNASYTPAGSFLDVSLKKWTIGINITMMSMITLVQAFLPGMLERGHGRVLAIGSRVATHGTEPPPDWTPAPLGGSVPLVYGTTKAALERLTTGLHDEYGGRGVSFNNLRAAAFASESWSMLAASMNHGKPVDEVHTPDEVAMSVLWLLRQPATYSGRIVGFDALQDLEVLPRRWS